MKRLFPAAVFSNQPSIRDAVFRLDGRTIYYTRNSGEFFGTYYDIVKKQMYTLLPEWQPGPDSVVMDIGANIGLYTLYASRRARNGLILSFEPNPEAFDKLQKNMKENNCDNVILFKSAVGDRTGDTGFLVFSSSSTIGKITTEKEPGGTEITVPMTTIDEVVTAKNLKHIDILKIDVEGFAAKVFQGARNSLPLVQHIVMETHNDEERALKTTLSQSFRHVMTRDGHIDYLERITSQIHPL